MTPIENFCEAMQELISSDPNLKAIFERADAEKERTARIEAAAQALVNLWDTMGWKDETYTGDYINALRDTLLNK